MSYLEDYIFSINYLPIEFQRSLELIKQLDILAENTNSDLQTLTSDYFNSLSKDGNLLTEDKEKLSSIRYKQKEVGNLNDEKIVISKQMVDVLDLQIKKLEKDLFKFSKEIKSDEESLTVAETPQKRVKIDKDMTFTNMSEDYNMFMEDETKPYEFQSEIKQTYCVCNKASYGDMIACDNPTCKHEWFHFTCVGLTSQPNGQWYCPDCRKI